MPEAIENYVSQTAVGNQRRQAVVAWSVIFIVAVLWISAILVAPLAKASGFNNFSNSIYNFFSHLCHQMEWRSFHLDGYPLAVCARCFGFYAGFLFGLAVYPLIRSLNNTDSFSRFWLFLAMIPMGVDWSLTFFGIWENTHFSRLITGAILGAACAFFIIPALVEISFYLSGKFRNRA